MTDSAVLGHELLGKGPQRVIVMNDWLCDTSTWDGAKPLLDVERFTYAFADLRGYGRSRGQTGAFNLREAVADILLLSESLGWERFAIVGHSMSSLIALHLAQHHAKRIEKAVLLTPPPPSGFGVDEATLASIQGLVLGDPEKRLNYLLQRFGVRLSRNWASYKAARWQACSDAAAAAGYVSLFARDGVPDPAARVSIPLLAITGEHDDPPMRQQAVTAALGPLCEQLVVTPLADSGHYPMQEVPPLTVSLIERFLDAGT